MSGGVFHGGGLGGNHGGGFGGISFSGWSHGLINRGWRYFRVGWGYRITTVVLGTFRIHTTGGNSAVE